MLLFVHREVNLVTNSARGLRRCEERKISLNVNTNNTGPGILKTALSNRLIVVHGEFYKRNSNFTDFSEAKVRSCEQDSDN